MRRFADIIYLGCEETRLWQSKQESRLGSNMRASLYDDLTKLAKDNGQTTTLCFGTGSKNTTFDLLLQHRVSCVPRLWRMCAVPWIRTESCFSFWLSRCHRGFTRPVAETIETHRLLIEEFGGHHGIRGYGIARVRRTRPQNGYYSNLIDEHPR